MFWVIEFLKIEWITTHSAGVVTGTAPPGPCLEKEKKQDNIRTKN